MEWDISNTFMGDKMLDSVMVKNTIDKYGERTIGARQNLKALGEETVKATNLSYMYAYGNSFTQIYPDITFGKFNLETGKIVPRYSLKDDIEKKAVIKYNENTKGVETDSELNNLRTRSLERDGDNQQGIQLGDDNRRTNQRNEKPTTLDGKLYFKQGQTENDSRSIAGNLLSEKTYNFLSKELNVTNFDYANTDKDTFYNSFKSAYDNLLNKEYVTLPENSDNYDNAKLILLSSDQQSGLVVTHTGDVVSVFNTGKGKRGVLKTIMPIAIENGGVKLDNFDGGLSRLYTQYGFEPVVKVKFNKDYAPVGWNYEQNGEPDVVFWIRKNENLETTLNNLKNNTFDIYDTTQVPYINEIQGYEQLDAYDYDNAYQYRDSFIKNNNRYSLKLNKNQKQFTESVSQVLKGQIDWDTIAELGDDKLFTIEVNQEALWRSFYAFREEIEDIAKYGRNINLELKTDLEQNLINRIADRLLDGLVYDPSGKSFYAEKI